MWKLCIFNTWSVVFNTWLVVELSPFFSEKKKMDHLTKSLTHNTKITYLLVLMHLHLQKTIHANVISTLSSHIEITDPVYIVLGH